VENCGGPALVEFFEELIEARLLVFTQHPADLIPV